MNLVAGDTTEIAHCHIFEELVKSDEMLEMLWYGISVTVGNKTIRVYHSLSNHRELVENLVYNLNRDGFSINQLDFILSDWLGSL